MPVTYFIADLHLSPEHPEITTCLKHFLTTQAVDADALYVLGDLFEAWIGDDDINPFTQEVTQAFRQLSERGVAIYFIHGNRDFLIRKAFTKRAGMTLLPESDVIDLYGEATLIMHGDELCTKDEAYQRFRRKARSWWWPRLILMLPLSVRRKIAARGRKISQQNQSTLSLDIMDVTPEEVVRVMQDNGVKRLIHGHTHRPAIHDLEINSEPAQRIVLGDWYTQGSMLKVTPTEITLETMQFEV
ncbi:UDP-2,3-diacylglucosamine diphosphatase [Paraneptunicella aestuarii]|uniref:UDP-2,3-diacylglucosamine diphosphatase n=1 Tax=Paraneptunicella aestuarii TaxID=2831148 RepID=UPI001E469080|nr:UDP-2,3-diacylglucosamine diphosphatase [Paraneptunicella aestuarii]UAA40090.1 UDP-2,3-diacylglucosamine diphosphatase [Paraneptunicella aestuarii]